MSSLVSRMKITKIVATDETGVDHEFEGEGITQLRGVGTFVETVEIFLKLGSQ